ncbi:MAG: DEAD/DEAH box helicase [Parvularculaceae bacterium]|nr:DEAD/DEAH box helicase [Parvularculaceae bacterium]
MTDFSTFNLAAPIAKAVAASGYATPTPIQRETIPLALNGRDVLGVAQTGTGKTAAFALPILNHLALNPKSLTRRSTRALVLAPTRELAGQIGESFASYGRNLRGSIATVFGGAPINRQIRLLDPGVDVLVATPGRLIDLIERKSLSLAAVEILVLDEADQMLDLGFIHALRRIVSLLPKERQTLFFSATMPKSIGELASQYLNDPARVSVAPAATTAERIDQRVMFVRQTDKQEALARILADPAVTRALVFTRTKHGADRVVKRLAAAGIEAAAIHGNKSQSQRERALSSFKSGRRSVLVATDIAARGIDIDDVSHVVNFEIPNVPEQYVHRIGRTARAGRAGFALSLVDESERGFLRDIERLTRGRIAVDGRSTGGEHPPPRPETAPARPPEARQPSGEARRRSRRGRGPRARAA